MSHNLRRLRDLFEDPLLEREGGRLRATDRGLALWAPVREALEGLETGLDMARCFDPATAQKVFRISLPDYLAPEVLSKLLTVSTRAPGLQFRIESLEREPGAAALGEGRLDAYVGVMTASDWTIETPLFEDDFVTVYDPNLWPEPPAAIRSFAAAPHILVSQADSFEGWVDTALAEHDLSRSVVASVSRFGDAVSGVPGTRLLATLPRRAAPAPSDGLALCEPAVGSRRFTVSLYRRRRAVGAPASEWLSEQIQNCFS